MILSFINIRPVPREMLKTFGFALGFHISLGTLKMSIMFDPYITYPQTVKALNSSHVYRNRCMAFAFWAVFL